jgi:hypothetical protein
LFGALIVLAMNLRPGGLLDAQTAAALQRLRGLLRGSGAARRMSRKGASGA